MINRYIKKIKRNIEDYGINILLKKVLSELFGFLYLQRTYRVYFYDLTQPVSVMNNQSHIQIRRIEPNELNLILQIEEMSEWLQGKLRGKLIHGDICIGAMDKEKVAGYNLLTFGNVMIPLLKYIKSFKSKVAWSEHIAIAKEYRRQGIAGLLRNKVFIILQNLGYTRLFGGTLITNSASLKLAQKLGFKMLVDITYYRILLIRKWKFKRIRV